LGTDIHSHGTMPTAGVIRPIEDWTTEDVWDYLIKPDWVDGGQNPFYEVNQGLAVLYKDAASGECPVIHDASRQTCAGSRFGCWTCTVVEVDNSLREMIGSEREGYDMKSLTMLADFRDDLRRERNLPENRVHGRNRRGVTLVQRDGSVGVGSYTMDYRRGLLEKLKSMQDRIGDVLITPEEESRIKQIWAEEQANLVLLLDSKIGGPE